MTDRFFFQREFSFCESNFLLLTGFYYILFVLENSFIGQEKIFSSCDMNYFLWQIYTHYGRKSLSVILKFISYPFQISLLVTRNLNCNMKFLFVKEEIPLIKIKFHFTEINLVCLVPALFMTVRWFVQACQPNFYGSRLLLKSWKPCVHQFNFNFQDFPTL